MDAELQLESKDFDVVILGTGLTESLLSAALARIGKTVLHLDENKYYGSQEASVSLDVLNEILVANQNVKNNSSEPSFEIKPCIPVKQSSSYGTSCIRNVSIGSEVEKVSNTEILSNSSFCRRCSIDLSPKLIWSRSIVIDTLIRAGVSRYLEFKTVQHIYMHSNKHELLIQVPVSKSDVFKTTHLSLLEKRQLMKFITSVSEKDEKETELFEDASKNSFFAFLNSKNLSPNLISFIQYAIALETYPTESDKSLNISEGIDAILRFLGSVGRYGGNSPWIYPLFGTGDLNQSFCRLSAVYGAVFVLGSHVTEMKLDLNDGNKIVSVNAGSTKDLNCKFVVSNFDHLPEFCSNDQKIQEMEGKSMSRCVMIIDKPLKTKEGLQEIMLAVLPPLSFGNQNTIYMLQLDESSSCAPRDTYLIQVWTKGSGNGPEADLKAAVESFINNDQNPTVHWISYFSQVERSIRNDVVMPSNLIMIPDMAAEFEADGHFINAQQIFNQLYPGEEFIPTVPNPEDIIWGGNEEEEENGDAKEESEL